MLCEGEKLLLMLHDIDREADLLWEIDSERLWLYD